MTLSIGVSIFLKYRALWKGYFLCRFYTVKHCTEVGLEPKCQKKQISLFLFTGPNSCK